MNRNLNIFKISGIYHYLLMGYDAGVFNIGIK